MRHRALLTGKRLPEMYRRPFERVQWFPERLAEPLRWRKPQIVFVGSQTDLFHAEVPFERIAAVFGVMAACPQHLFLVVTKRIERVPEWLAWVHQFGELRSDTLMRLRSHVSRLGEIKLEGGVHENGVDWPLRNVLLVATACTQAELDRAAPILVELAENGWRTGLSLEPLLERVDLVKAGVLGCDCPPLELDNGEVEDRCSGQCAFYRAGGKKRIEWVAVGGESGPRARPCDLSWIRSVIEQCKDAGVRCFAKQLGSLSVTAPLTCCDECGPHVAIDEDGCCVHCGADVSMPPTTARIRLRSRSGADPEEWAPELRVRELPEMSR